MPNSSQKNTSEQIRIRDLRTKEKYQINDKYLNGFARRCGWQATLVYNSLCRHASKDQFSFPTIMQMAAQHSVGRKTIIKGVKNLVNHNLIKVIKKKTRGHKFLNNGYILMDKSEWTVEAEDKNQVPERDAVKPGPLEGRGSRSSQVPERDHKDTHTKGNTVEREYNFSSQAFFTNPPDGYVDKLWDEYQIPKSFILDELDSALNWLKSNNKRKTDYNRFFRNIF